MQGPARKHFDFIMNEKIIQPVVDPVFTNPKGEKVYLPHGILYFVKSPNGSGPANNSCFIPLLILSPDGIILPHKHAANFLLNVGAQ